MQKYKYKHLFITSLILLILSCSDNNNGKSMLTANTDIDTLVKFINLPKTPIKATWETGDIIKGNSTVPGPKDWALIALLEFDKNDVTEFIKQSTSNTSKTANIPKSHFSSWLPVEISSKFSIDSSGGYYQSSSTTHDATLFSKSPLLNGFYIQLNETELLLYLYSN